MPYSKIDDNKIKLTGVQDSVCVMIADEAELEDLKSYPTDTIAYTAQYAKMWKKNVDGTWVVLSSGGGGDFITAEVTIKNASTAESAAGLLIEFAPVPEENYVSGMFVDLEEGITVSPMSIENIPIGGEIKRTFYILDENKIVAYDEADYAFQALISVEGAANIATDAAGRYIKIFGNCTINLTSAPK